MNVAELIEKLQAMPGHLPVHIEVPEDGSGGGADMGYLFTLDAEVSSHGTYGRMAVILINENPTSAGFLLKKRRRHSVKGST